MISPFFKGWPYSCGYLFAALQTFIAATAGMAFIWPPDATAAEKEKFVLGAVEQVIIMPWSIQLPARIDSGAAHSSLDARNLKIEGSEAVFSLPARCGGKRVRLPVKGWQKVKSSHGVTKRPLIEIEICIGAKRIPATVNLIDRTQMNFPMIIGRDVLENGFVVDVTKSSVTSPACPDGDRK